MILILIFSINNWDLWIFYYLRISVLLLLKLLIKLSLDESHQKLFKYYKKILKILIKKENYFI